MVNVQYEDQEVNLPLIIVKGADKAALCGLQWLEHIKLNWQKVCCMQGFVSGVLVKHSEVFGEGLGMLKGTTDKIYVVSDQPPIFFKQWSVPYALKKRVEEELDRLVQTKVIDPVCNSDWATPIMPILKADGKVLVCGDYELTGKQFTKLELSHAYSQLPLDAKHTQEVD